jgi:hypothetical protein
VHDFDPGIHPYPHGLFWTAPLPSEGVTVHLGAGTARMTAANLHVRDFFNIPNALFRFQTPVSAGAAVSFDIRWLGPPSARSPVTSPPGSAGQVLMSPVTMRWSATNASGFRFASHPSGTKSIFGQLGRVRNGIFA